MFTATINGVTTHDVGDVLAAGFKTITGRVGRKLSTPRMKPAPFGVDEKTYLGAWATDPDGRFGQVWAIAPEKGYVWFVITEDGVNRAVQTCAAELVIYGKAGDSTIPF